MPTRDNARNLPFLARSALACLPALAAALLAAPATAQDDAVAETIDVAVVNVEVVVTDKDGRPVTGLSRDDFELTLEGEPVDLTNFYAVEAPTEVSGTAPAGALSAGTVTAGTLTAGALPSGAIGTRGLHLVIFVDQLNIGPRNRKLLFDQLRQHLREHLGDGSQAMVAVMGGRLEVPLQFTDDAEEIFAVLDAEQKKTSLHQVMDAETRQFMNRVRRASVREYTVDETAILTDPFTGERNIAETDGDPEFDRAVRAAMELAITARTLAERRTQKARATVEALGALSDQLAKMPGRKALLYLSDGLPLRPAESLLTAWTEKFEAWAIQNGNDILQQSKIPEADREFQQIITSIGSGQFDLRDDVERLTARASAARVAFYPISNGGRDHGAVAADQSGGTTGSGGTGRAAATAESFTRAAALMQLADDTGGVAMIESANLGRLLERLRSDFESFYSLGFAAAAPSGGAFQKLNVAVRREGVSVRHVKGVAGRAHGPAGEIAAARGAAAADGAVDGEIIVSGEEAVAASLAGDDAVSEVIDVRVANVEVVVTDKDGQPITGLTRDQFELYENGRRMELTNFYAIEPGDGDARETPAPELSPAVAPAASGTARPPSATSDLHLVVYVDNLNITPQSRKLLFENLRRHLAEHRGQPMMLVTMNRRVEVALPFSRDLDEILATLDEIEKQGSPHALAEGSRRIFMSRLERASLRRYDPQPGAEGDPDFEDAVRVALELSEGVRALAEERYQKVVTTLEALGGLCDALGGLAGRKALVYLSDGLPLRPADSLVEAWTGKYQGWVIDSEDDIRRRSRFPGAADDFQRLMNSIGSSQFDLQSELNRLTVQASDNRVAFYPISRSGRAADFVSAEHGGYATHGSGGTRREAMVAESFTRDVSLMRMAEDTGGVAVLHNANLGRLLEQVERDFSSFYSLGYRPPTGDGEISFRRLEVKVSHPRARVRHVKGLRDKNWRQRLGEMTTAAALFAVESNPLGVRVTPGEMVEDDDGFVVPIMVKIPFHQVRLVHSDRHFNAQLTVLVQVQGSDDGLSSVRRFDLPIKIPDSRVLEVLPQVAAYPLELRMPKGARRLAIGVRDHLAQTEATVKFDLVTGETR